MLSFNEAALKFEDDIYLNTDFLNQSELSIEFNNDGSHGTVVLYDYIFYSVHDILSYFGIDVRYMWKELK